MAMWTCKSPPSAYEGQYLEVYDYGRDYRLGLALVACALAGLGAGLARWWRAR